MRNQQIEILSFRRPVPLLHFDLMITSFNLPKSNDLQIHNDEINAMAEFKLNKNKKLYPQHPIRTDQYSSFTKSYLIWKRADEWQLIMEFIQKSIAFTTELPTLKWEIILTFTGWFAPSSYSFVSLQCLIHCVSSTECICALQWPVHKEKQRTMKLGWLESLRNISYIVHTSATWNACANQYSNQYYSFTTNQKCKLKIQKF